MDTNHDGILTEQEFKNAPNPKGGKLKDKHQNACLFNFITPRVFILSENKLNNRRNITILSI